ncbi:YopX family protein [Bacillus subtilis]|uniref:YopX family protein n=1 Tax=Bacillus subtilis TaxID=1423 RepID=UPI0027291B07|nr:YopX family protein [Bacillus subtilis]MDP0485101.1 YopX family protein [Bacillus subtilis]
MREIKFRAWSNKYQHMFRVSEISQDRSGYTHGIVDAEFKNEFEPEFDSPFAWIGRVDFKKSSDGRVAALGQNPDDEPFYLMQYTGFKDKNDREIYEGDIVKVTNGAEELGGVDTGIGKVEWLTKWGFWNVSKIENGLGDLLFNGYVEVIGNIYEDPELLEAPHASK